MLKFGYIKYGLIAIMSASLLCGCSENVYEGWHNEPMSFTATISFSKHTRATADSAMAGSNLIVVAADTAKETVENAGKKTRASTTPDGTWPSGANVAMQISRNSNTTKYTVSTGTVASGSPLYWTSNGNVTVNSWYPYSSSMPSSWTVQSDQSASDASGYNNSDFLYASNTFTYGGGSNNKLTYNHGTAKVVINIVKANDVTSASNISFVTIGTSGTPISLSGNVNGSSGTLTAVPPSSGSTTSYITPYANTSFDATNYAASYSALVIPQDMNGKQFIAIKVAGGNIFYYTPSTSTSLSGGYVYTYNITVPSSTTNTGDYYFSDGSWGTLAVHATSAVKPIAVVFSSGIKGSAAYTAGYTHGLAIALTNANNGDWASSSSVLQSSYNFSSASTAAADVSSGYTGGITKGYGKVSSDYAFYYCGSGYTAVSAPSSSSGWYLPSAGEIIAMYKGLGLLSSSTSITSFTPYSIISTAAYNTFQAYFTNATTASVTPVAPAPHCYYWSSSEYGSGYACELYYYSSAVSFNYDNKPNCNDYYRSILAF